MGKISHSNSRRRKARKGGAKAVDIIITVSVIAVLLMLARWGWSALEKNRLAQEHLQALRLQKERLEFVQANLREEIENLENPAYIEELAREQLGLVRKGEILIAPREES
jgi:cell division protein DivIC